MILCGICHKWQHAACFGLLEEETVPELHVCEMCGMVYPSSSYIIIIIINMIITGSYSFMYRS